MGTGIALIHCELLDVKRGKLLRDRTILFDKAGTFTAVGSFADIAIPEGYERIDLTGKIVMPGLINAHIHLFSGGAPVSKLPGPRVMKLIYTIAGTAIGKAFLKRKMKERILASLHSGVTTIRCVGDLFYKDVELRDYITEGKVSSPSKLVIGPSMLVSGPMLSAPGGHGTPYLAMSGDSPSMFRELVRQNIRAGADFIKICVTGGVTDAREKGEAGKLQMTQKEIDAVCEEAHKAGLLVAAHAESTEGVRLALRGGVDTIEHGSVMDEEIIRLFNENPLALRGWSALVPTLYAAVPGLLDHKITQFSDIALFNSNMVFRGMVTGLRQALEAGIKIGLGTDAAMPYVTHYNTWRELEYLMHFGGLTAGQALYHASLSNAEVLGISDRTGSIEPGKDADFIVLEEDPLKNVRTLSSPLMVCAKGCLIRQPRIKKNGSIDSILDSLKLP